MMGPQMMFGMGGFGFQYNFGGGNDQQGRGRINFNWVSCAIFVFMLIFSLGSEFSISSFEGLDLEDPVNWRGNQYQGNRQRRQSRAQRQRERTSPRGTIQQETGNQGSFIFGLIYSAVLIGFMGYFILQRNWVARRVR